MKIMTVSGVKRTPFKILLSAVILAAGLSAVVLLGLQLAVGETILVDSVEIIISPGEYNQLELIPEQDDIRYILGDGSDQTITIFGDLILGTSTLASVVDGREHNPILDVQGDIVIASSTTFQAPDLVTIAGDWDNQGGFEHHDGQVELAGCDQTFSGSTVFYNLTQQITNQQTCTWTFEAGTRQTVENTWTAHGYSSVYQLKLRSDAEDHWEIDPFLRDIYALDVQYSHNVNETKIDATDSSHQDSGDNINWNFETTELSFILSDNQVGFGSVLPQTPRFATADNEGASSEVSAHTLTAEAEVSFVISLLGSSLEAGGHIIDPIGDTAQEPDPDTEQFGLRLLTESGSGTVTSPYDGSGFAFGADSETSDQVAEGSGGEEIIFSSRYLTNVLHQTPIDQYQTGLEYIMTEEF